MRIIDTHQHLWNHEQFSYSWCKDLPALNRTFTLDDYLDAAAGSGIERAVFVECDVDEPYGPDETRFYHALAEKHPVVAGIVASCRPEHGDFAAELKTLGRLPLVKGVRRVLHVVSDEISQSPRFVDNVRRLAEHGLSFDLCVLERQLPLARALVEKCPEVSFILDHCGVPDIKSGTADFWCREMTALSAYPNVVCKISGLVAYAEQGRHKAVDLEPWVHHVLASFGWNRVLWGGDWPVCTLATPLADWVNITKSLVSHASKDQQEQLFWRNAKHIYRLEL